MTARGMFNILLVLLAVSGLLIAGGEVQSNSLLKQMVSSVIGVMIFSISMLSLVYMNGEGE